MIALTLALAVVVGVSLGMLGGGGSILTVPLLVYVAGQDPKSAIVTSLLVVGVTSATGAIAHARAGRVDWRTGLVFGGAGMVGAYAGGRMGSHVDGTVLLSAFAVMMGITAVAMLRGNGGPSTDGTADVRVVKVVVEGVVVGLVTGLVGAGGGFLVVPALVLFGGVPMSVAVGTSLLVIAMKSAAGILGYLHGVQIDWPVALGVTAAAVAGSLLGERLAGHTSQDRLRVAFGWLVAVMAMVVLVQEMPDHFVRTVVTSPVTWSGLAVLTGARVALWRRGRRTEAIDNRAAGTSTHPEPLGDGRVQVRHGEPRRHPS